MMNYKNFSYKNKTIFLSVCVACLISQASFCLARNVSEERKMVFSVDKNPFLESASFYHTKNESFLFAFWQKKITANIQNHATIKNIFAWILLPSLVVAVFGGYFFGKRAGMKIALAKTNQESVPAPMVLNKVEKFDDLAAKDKPFIQKYDMVTVLFADIVGFSEITDSLDPETLLDELNNFFFYFDTIIDRYHIEKIKTMGDAYMCAGGIPHKNHTNPVDVVLAALNVQEHLKQLRANNPRVWSVRIGIHTGQVVAGMLGHKKLSYDIWGHTVNVAARLEQSCKACRINISGATYEKIKQFFDCEFHGILEETNDASYFVNGLKQDYVEENGEGQLIPNHDFLVQMQLLRLEDLEEYVKNMMSDNGSKLLFHNFKHVRNVYEQVEKLARSENLDVEDVLLLKTAALLHDIGYSIAYGEDLQSLSEDMARETLPIFQYLPRQVDKVCKLMQAAHIESVPNGLPEEIIRDANLMYYGQEDYATQSICLFYELKNHGIPGSKSEWIKNQINRLNNHHFYTRAAKESVKMTAEQQIALLTLKMN